jgi:hypothetical protein
MGQKTNRRALQNATIEGEVQTSARQSCMDAPEQIVILESTPCLDSVILTIKKCKERNRELECMLNLDCMHELARLPLKNVHDRLLTECSAGSQQGNFTVRDSSISDARVDSNTNIC